MRENGAGKDREPPDPADPPARRFGAEALGAEVSRLTAELEAMVAKLRRDRHGSRSAEPTGELGEDHQVGVEPNPV